MTDADIHRVSSAQSITSGHNSHNSRPPTSVSVGRGVEQSIDRENLVAMLRTHQMQKHTGLIKVGRDGVAIEVNEVDLDSSSGESDDDDASEFVDVSEI